VFPISSKDVMALFGRAREFGYMGSKGVTQLALESRGEPLVFPVTRIDSTSWLSE